MVRCIGLVHYGHDSDGYSIANIELSYAAPIAQREEWRICTPLMQVRVLLGAIRESVIGVYTARRGTID